MRKMETAKIVAILSGLLVMVVMWLWFSNNRFFVWNRLTYPAFRSVGTYQVERKTQGFAVRQSEHFTLRYLPQDGQDVDMVLRVAEDAYNAVNQEFGFVPAAKTLLVMQPDRAALRQAFGWKSTEDAMGVYWAGAIQILAPDQWLKPQEPIQRALEFEKTGPLAHEYTHLVIDAMLWGNYPLWFTEGMAQYSEYKLYGYEWLTRTNHMNGLLYSMAKLTHLFSELPDQSLAYRESLLAIRYLAEQGQPDCLRTILRQMQKGQSFETSLMQVTGMTMAQFEQNWQNWAVRQEL